MKAAKTSVAAELRDERRRVAQDERAEPLRRRLLVALGASDATPTELAKAIGSNKESVSRKLKELRDAGMVTAVTDVVDRRRSTYSITRAGSAELGRYLAFGKAEKAPPAPSKAADAEFLEEALGGAVTIRRRSNRLREAGERLADIRAQAVELEAPELALESLVELTITQRQNREVAEWEGSLALLKGYALGEGGVAPQLIYPAVAHLEYEHGKAGDLGETEVAALARHLTAAMSLFENLMEERPASAGRWRSRRAWSVVSLANNLREQSRYEDSLQYAASGLLLFEDLDDDYGRTQCWFLFGFCFRLLQRFDVSWSCLQRAFALSTKKGNSFERATAYTLVQMGEVRRCQGQTSEAREVLTQALDQATRLGLGVARAFATSAMAASEFQDQDLELAAATLRKAQVHFDRNRHVEGTALNCRRQVTVARHLSAAGVPLSESHVKKLIKRAQRSYLAVGSPAGVAACEIERGWLRTSAPECGDRGEVVDRLAAMLTDADERQALELDPWVPRMLREFAKEVGGDFEKDARAVVKWGDRQIEEEGEQGVKSVARIADGLDGEGRAKTSKPVVEMGGESRRRKAPLELTAA